VKTITNQQVNKETVMSEEERERGFVSSNQQPPLAALTGSVFCFNCKHWVGKRRKQTAYCLSEKDAPSGCVLWEMLHGTKL